MFRFASRARASAFSTKMPGYTPKRRISTIGVVGGGQMGTGIALVSAVTAKKNVIIMDVADRQLENSIAFTEKLLSKYVKQGKLNQEEADAARARISTVNDYAGLKDVDFMIEAATENVDLKRSIFKDLDAATRPEIILASNTSSISITKIAAATTRPDKVIGMHFFSPVPVMKICEIISGLETSTATLDATLALAKSMDKVTTTSKNTPGFIANRVLMPYINEAFQVLDAGIASKEDIDTTMKLGTAVPMGPLALADFIGLDTCLSIMQVMHAGFGGSKYKPSPLLQQYVDAGLLGKKVGRGVYDYNQS